MKQRTVRVFLSSTFRDFDEERDLLVRKVFPALRARLKDRFVELVDIDLRWGISAEEAEQGKVLSICLDEIDQCRPYFIGLLGERYGWVPTPEGYDIQLADAHPWLSEHQGTASVTELEIRYGVLDDPAMHQRALFFFRDPAYAHQRGGEFLYSDETDRQRQWKLKASITNSGLPTFDYREPEDLAVLLESQLWTLLDAEFPEESAPNPHELDTLGHHAFASAKVGARFVENPSLQHHLQGLLKENHQCLLITGPAGIGKSTLLADWFTKKDHSNDFVFYHALEANERSVRTVDVLRRLFEWIRSQALSDDIVPEDHAGIIKGLPEWLATAHAFANLKKIRWIIVLDGLDRLRNEHDLLWLPTFIPESVKLVVSCRPGSLQNALKRRVKWTVMELQALQPESRLQLFKGQLTAFKKQLNESQLAAVIQHPRADRPLFLSTLSEELRIFGSFEGLQGHLEKLLACDEMDDLYEKIIERLEANHDVTGVSRALSALCLSQSGLTEIEVLEFSKLTYQARWSPIRLALGEALFYSTGRIRPAHDFLRKAVRDRYYPKPEIEQVKRLELARWFGQRTLDRRRAWEQPAQLALAGAHHELMLLLSDKDVFELIHRMGGNERLHRYWIDIEAKMGVAPSVHYKILWSDWRSQMTLEQRLEMSARLQRFIRYQGRHEEFISQLAQERLDDCKQVYGESHIRYLRQLGACAKTLALQKDQLDQARSLSNQACIGVEINTGQKAKDLPEQLLVLAGICLKQRDLESGVTAARRGLKLMEDKDGLEHPNLIPHLNCLTDLLMVNAGRALKGDDGQLKVNKQLFEGINLQNRCLNILNRSRGLEHLDSAACLVRTGHLFKKCGELDLAIKAYKRAMTIRLRLLGKVHPLTLSAQKLWDKEMSTKSAE